MSIWDPKETLDSIGLGTKNEVKRSTRVADVIRNELSVLLLEKVRDPKLQDVSISRVSVTDDLEIAKIYYTIYGPHKSIKAVGESFSSAKGFMRSHLAKTLNMRHTPKLQFFYDKKAEKIEALEGIFQELAQERNSQKNDTKDNS
ncbi:MAG: 30S ribosome-binding factor RbfA [Desulfotalea sp.]